ncbi:Lysophospholipase L1 [Malonomonas rubra DSM 5091]|uniref:Lysophospholipase L1 n=1 Tax=Malonomonas rubra DSM 5091 TaxID=1122189 RepID=A0A1M6HDI1_MALRU|nr:arylesterase [Malonomonas rubra]SHJ20176.1 Lysophospholipase L1 [Malonomonas rubra DSM 5091]
MFRILKWLSIVLILLSLIACDSGQIFHKLRPSSVILAFGDSLTYGTGAEEGNSYPVQLQHLTARNVHNAGVPGEVSAEGARRLPTVLDEVEPDLVILCHGGNDMLRKLDKQQLKNNLRRMFEAVNQRGIPMIMIAVPRPGLLLSDADVYEDLAKELNIPLVDDILGDLLSKRELKSDHVHLNAAGYRKLAEAVAEKLVDLRAI